MRAILIILAVIGGLFVLAVGGCVGCAALVVAAAPERPDHHSRAAIDGRYGGAIAAAEAELAAGTVPTAPPIVAVFRVVEQEVGTDDHEAVHPAGAETNSHVMWNGAGTFRVTLPGQPAAAYPAIQVEADGATWILCFEDWTPEPEPQRATP